jgi:hypothetical protein
VEQLLYRQPVVAFVGAIRSTAANRGKTTLLHGVPQHLTAQGTPPADLGHWVEIYAAAGCEVIHAYESESNGIDWFMHVVQL